MKGSFVFDLHLNSGDGLHRVVQSEDVIWLMHLYTFLGSFVHHGIFFLSCLMVVIYIFISVSFFVCEHLRMCL